MRTLRIPLGGWDWRGTALVLVIMLAPLLAAASLAPHGDVLATTLGTRSLLVGMATLAASVFLYLHWRLTASDPSGWLAMLLSVAAVPGIALGAFALTHPALVEAHATLLLVFRVAVGGGLVAGALLARRRPVRVDPLAVGLAVGVALASVRQVLLLEVPALPVPPPLELFRIALLAALTVTLAVAVSQLDGLPHWVRTRVTTGVLLLGLGSTVTGPAALLTGLLGAVLLAGTAAAVLHQAIDREKARVAELHERLDAVETGLREDRARLHEIDATVAGIASAQQLMQTAGLAADRNEALAAMMYAEVERLQRLLADRVPTRRRSVDLDDVVGQIVLSHVARGRSVGWEPAGRRAVGRADDIAEIVNVLLENAAVHGGAERVSVHVDSDDTGEGLTLTVSDRGPGVPPELQDRIFDWGLSRPGSPGQGIGLHVAAELAHEMGGRLELRPSLRGATFALHLPEAPREVTTRDDHVRHAS